jgi:hypothetical protein
MKRIAVVSSVLLCLLVLAAPAQASAPSESGLDFDLSVLVQPFDAAWDAIGTALKSFVSTDDPESAPAPPAAQSESGDDNDSDEDPILEAGPGMEPVG